MVINDVFAQDKLIQITTQWSSFGLWENNEMLTHLPFRYCCCAVSRVTARGMDRKIGTKCMPSMRFWIHQLLAWISGDAQDVGQRRFLCCCKMILIWTCYAGSLPGFTAVPEYLPLSLSFSVSFPLTLSLPLYQHHYVVVDAWIKYRFWASLSREKNRCLFTDVLVSNYTSADTQPIIKVFFIMQCK